ncbi:MAG: Subunit of the glycosylphosphatidylinositol transamidase complex-like protein [Phylliscum demangeonii]|nr:MAG: Subunit of the glycosylphosphatidylinositol transamidase complex-like protein [Phylliscum demangeonii]
MIVSWQLVVLLRIALSAALVGAAGAADYHERLVMQPLAGPAPALLASFNFRSRESQSAINQHHYRLFPRSLGQILQHAHTHELHLRFTLGRWDAEHWGQRPWDGAKEGGTGVELWAWVEASSAREAEAGWVTLTNALSGLFCASLNFIDRSRTIRPRMAFRPTGDHANGTLAGLHLLHGTLPREPVCTENLTPFLKLLPCKGQAGISTLLDGHKLFDASWQSMSIDVRPVGGGGVANSDEDERMLEIDQTVDLVLDIERAKRPRDNPIPRPVAPQDLVCDPTKPYASDEACYPLDSTATEPAWTLAEVFGRGMRGVCALGSDDDDDHHEDDPRAADGPAATTTGSASTSTSTSTSSVCIRVPPERLVSVPADTREEQGVDGDANLRCFQPSATSDLFDMVLPRQPVATPLPLAPPALFAERSLTGHGQERGGVRTILRNPSRSDAITFVYLETLPWFMRTYLHTLTATVVSPSPSSSPHPPVIQHLHYRPGSDRHRPTHLELTMQIPAQFTVVLGYAFEKAILRYTEYPPDANRGFDIPAAIVRVLPNAKGGGGGGGQYLRTTTLLLSLPTPDFSMPYNVIILTSTVMALAFGSIFNLLVRRFVAADEVPPAALPPLLRARVLRPLLRGARGVRKVAERAWAGAGAGAGRGAGARRTREEGLKEE